MSERCVPDPVFVLRGASGPINTINFCNGVNSDESVLVSGCAKGEIRLWNLKTRRAEVVIEGHDGKGIVWADFIDGSKLISQGRDNQINVWHFGNGRQDIVGSITSESIGFCPCAMLQQDRQLLAVAGREPSVVEIYNVNTSEKITTIVPPEGARGLGMVMKMKLFLSHSGRERLLAGYEDGSVALWDVSESKVICKVKVHNEPVMGLDYSILQRRGVSGSADEKIISWKLDETDGFQLQHEAKITNAGISDIKIRDDDKFLAAAGWDSRIRVFGFKKLKPLAVLAYHRESVHCLAFSTGSDVTNPLLAAGSKDKHISLWSLYN
ncbi:guanine nucleotide-binding protein subunit beta-like protein 1 [Glandiceps talaboti]